MAAHTVSFSKDNEAARRRRRRRIVHTLRKPTTQPTKLAKESEVVSNGYLLGNSPLNINIFLDDFSAYCSLAQDNWRSAGYVDDGGTFSARSIFQINDGVDFIAKL